MTAREPLWASNGGRVVCRRHGGGYFTAYLVGHPNARTFTTPLDRWERVTGMDRIAWEREVGSPLVCEECRTAAPAPSPDPIQPQQAKEGIMPSHTDFTVTVASRGDFHTLVHKAACKRIPTKAARVLPDAEGYRTAVQAKCCKPDMAAFKGLDAVATAAPVDSKIGPGPKDVAASVTKAPKATKTTKTPAPAAASGPSVTFRINGKLRVTRTSPRPYTFSYLAGEVLGGKGASARLREMLAAQGITDPEHSAWGDVEVNGKLIGAVLAEAS